MRRVLPLIAYLGLLFPTQAGELSRFEFAQAQMGLEFRISLYTTNEFHARQCARAAFRRIEYLNGILSDYDSDSELSRLSRTSGSGDWVPVGPDLWNILESAQSLSRRTGGAFDITIGPSVNLWRRARRQEELPSPDLLNAMRERVGWRHLRLNHRNHSAKLTRENMRLDAGGIAKGYAMDEAMSVLHSLGIESALVQGGGDLLVSDPPPGERSWEIELIDPSGKSDPTATLHLNNRALATSGDLYQFLEIDGVRYSHIIDPRTGIGLTNRKLVHVIARDSRTADSLSTALSVMDSSEGLELVSQLDGVECQITLIQENELITEHSQGFEAYWKIP